MNKNDYIQLLNKPYSVSARQAQELEGILSEFPYLQSARALHLKALYNEDSFRYNLELKKTAAYTTDRSVLFDFITSEQFQSIQKQYHEQQQKAMEEITVAAAEILPPEVLPVTDKAAESVIRSIQVAEPQAVPAEEAAVPAEADKASDEGETAAGPTIAPVAGTEPGNVNEAAVHPSPEAEKVRIEEKLELGKPLAFEKNEKHSFAEWLQLSKLAPINREEEKTPEDAAKTDGPAEPLNRKLELIDRFIETNPKIVPVKGAIPPPVTIEKAAQDSSSLMTETLARVYLEQKKYQKAIQAYEILILKYPEKSVFFADRISEIKNLQQNN